MPPNKLEAYYQRGSRPLNIQEVEDVLSRFPMMPLPKNIVILDGVIDLPRGSTAVGATPFQSDVIILTPIADQETVLHERIHFGGGLGLSELATQIISRVQFVRLNWGLVPRVKWREVQYNQCTGCLSEKELLNRLGFEPASGYQGLPADIKHYRLTRG